MSGMVGRPQSFRFSRRHDLGTFSTCRSLEKIYLQEDASSRKGALSSYHKPHVTSSQGQCIIFNLNITAVSTEGHSSLFVILHQAMTT